MKNLGIANLDIYITGKCNFRCDYCYGEDDLCGSMSKTVYERALDFGKYIGAHTIQFCGGEPLVCPEFEAYSRLAKKNGFSVTLRTNGILIPEHLDFIAHNCDWVGISIDGMPYENALMRTSRVPMSAEEQFEFPMQAIFNLKKQNSKIKIILASIVSKRNFKGLPAFAEYLSKNDVPIDRWKVYEFIRDKFRSNVYYSEHAMSEKEFEELQQNMPSHLTSGVPIILQSARLPRVGGNCLIVSQNGDINILGIHYGNVSKDSFEVIVSRLIEQEALNAIAINKERTYGGEYNE